MSSSVLATIYRLRAVGQRADKVIADASEPIMMMYIVVGALTGVRRM